MSNYIYNPEEQHLGAVIFAEPSSAHPKMTDAEWDAMIAEQEAAKEYYYSPEAMSERVLKQVRSYEDMKREYEEKDGNVGRDNRYLPEGVTRGWNRDVHGMGEVIN